MLAHGAGWTTLNTQHWSGCHGSTHLAYSNRSAIFRQRSTKRSFKSSVRNSRSQRRRLEHSNNRASDKPGAIQTVSAVKQAFGRNYQRVVDAGRDIGIDRATGKPTPFYTVITNAWNELKTMFPGSPPR